MSAFRIERSRDGIAPRVYHETDSRLAVAVILKEDDGTVSLFPVKFNNAPYPLTGANMVFPSEAEIKAFLSIADEEIAA